MSEPSRETRAQKLARLQKLVEEYSELMYGDERDGFTGERRARAAYRTAASIVDLGTDLGLFTPNEAKRAHRVAAETEIARQAKTATAKLN